MEETDPYPELRNVSSRTETERGGNFSPEFSVVLLNFGSEILDFNSLNIAERDSSMFWFSFLTVSGRFDFVFDGVTGNIGFTTGGGGGATGISLIDVAAASDWSFRCFWVNMTPLT